jgi:hypothetical protein
MLLVAEELTAVGLTLSVWLPPQTFLLPAGSFLTSVNNLSRLPFSVKVMRLADKRMRPLARLPFAASRLLPLRYDPLGLEFVRKIVEPQNHRVDWIGGMELAWASALCPVPCGLQLRVTLLVELRPACRVLGAVH